MGLRTWFRAALAGDPEEERTAPAEPPRAIHQGPARLTPEKVQGNVRRFTLALEQCQKGEAREAELRRHLEHWQALAAVPAKPEA